MLRKNFPGRKYARRVNAIDTMQRLIEQYKNFLALENEHIEKISAMNVLQYNEHQGKDTLTKEDLDNAIAYSKEYVNITEKALARANLAIKNTQAKLGTKDQTHTKKSRVGKGKLAYN